MRLNRPMVQAMRRAFVVLVWFVLAMAAGAASAADAVGEVAFIQGIATAQTSGYAARFLAKGEPLYEGETLQTGAKGFALITLKDGSKLTLRPNTTFTLERFQQGGSEESV